MSFNINQPNFNYERLNNKIENYIPGEIYIVMSYDTAEVMDTDSNSVYPRKNNINQFNIYYHGYKVLINNSLEFGEIEIINR